MHQRREQQLAALKAELSSREQGRSRVADDLDAVRREAEQRVAEIQDVLAMDPARARDALRELFDGPAEAVPIMVNDRPRLLVRGRLRAGRKLRTDGEPGWMQRVSNWLAEVGEEELAGIRELMAG